MCNILLIGENISSLKLFIGNKRSTKPPVTYNYPGRYSFS